jgi:hypothetical protein
VSEFESVIAAEITNKSAGVRVLLSGQKGGVGFPSPSENDGWAE